MKRIALSALLILPLAGCGTFRTYDAKLSQSLDRARGGDLDGALAAIGRPSGDNDLLNHLERGELLRQKNDLAASDAAWRKADKVVQRWEDSARIAPERLLPGLGSYLINDKLRAYEGADYEKVLLSTRLALNHLARGDFATARVAIRRAHERETLIETYRAKEREAVEAEARDRGAKTRYQDLGGYPAQTLDSSEVQALRNSYQSAFTHYLAGFIYEALGEPSLAAAGYRKALELRPGAAVLEDGLASLDTRTSPSQRGATDVLFVIESGAVPARESQQFPLPVISSHGLQYVPLSFPVLRQEGRDAIGDTLRVDTLGDLGITTVADLDAMARRALRDDMPGLMLRALVRSTVKGVAQVQTHRNDKYGLALPAVALGAWLTESADERGWRALPGRISIARATLAPGPHRISLGANGRDHPVEVQIGGSHMVVSLRQMDRQLYVLTPRISDRTRAVSARAAELVPCCTTRMVLQGG